MLSPNKKREGNDRNNRQLMQYAGMATQFLVVIGIAVFAGLKADRWLNWGVPVCVWALPLLAIVAMIYGIIRSISK
jgi:hypothetical protein